MTRCDPDTEALGTFTIAETLQAWLAGSRPQLFVAEDASRWNGSSAFWVTETKCRPPE